MPMLHAMVRHLNRLFDDDHIREFAKQAHQFAPGQALDVDVLKFPNAALARRFQKYINHLPDGMKEVLRALFSHALSASPPIPMNFSWAPGYDYEMTMWEQECGILIQFRSPRSAEAG